MLRKSFVLLLWVTAFRALSLYLFTSGFLLTRLSLPNTTPRPSNVLKPTSVVIIIDALRFDFISPTLLNDPSYSPYHHNVLTLPAELTKKYPKRSLLFNALADPPTTEEIEEDSIIKQLKWIHYLPDFLRSQHDMAIRFIQRRRSAYSRQRRHHSSPSSPSLHLLPHVCAFTRPCSNNCALPRRSWAQPPHHGPKIDPIERRSKRSGRASY